MKIKFILILSFICSISCAYAQDGYKQDLLNLVTINFPSKPQVSGVSGKKVFYLADTEVNYIAMCQDLSQETGFELKSGDLSKFYEGNITGMLEASNGKLISKKPFEIDGFKGIDFVFETPTNPNVPELRFNRILFLNDIVFSVSFLVHPKDKVKTQSIRDQFLNSLAITAKKENLNQGTETKRVSAGNIGYMLGQVIFYVLLAGVIIFVLIRITRRKKS